MIKINSAWCKGCEICVAFCPKKSLAMKDNKAVVVDEASCISCRLCEYRCPDFAIFIEKKEDAS